MRVVTGVLIALLGLIQAELWFGKGGVPKMMDLTGKLRVQSASNAVAKERNDRMSAEVNDLKDGLEMVEEKARFELGMIKPDEIYVQNPVPRR